MSDKILMCLDFNDTIDDVIPKYHLAEAQGGYKMPYLFKGIVSLGIKTRMPIQAAVVSTASVDQIKDEVMLFNYIARKYTGTVAVDKDNFVRYIIGGRNQELFDCLTLEKIQLDTQPLTKKEGVENLLAHIGNEDVGLIITGGDSQEDIAMLGANTQGIRNIFVAPKANRGIEEFPDTIALRDPKNKASEGIGKCLLRVAGNLDEYLSESQFELQKSIAESISSQQEDACISLADYQEESQYTQESVSTQSVQESNSTQTEACITLTEQANSNIDNSAIINYFNNLKVAQPIIELGQ